MKIEHKLDKLKEWGFIKHDLGSSIFYFNKDEVWYDKQNGKITYFDTTTLEQTHLTDSNELITELKDAINTSYRKCLARGY